MSNPAFWVAFASLLLVFGGASILTGIRPSLGVAAIAVFLVPVTLTMHNFWTLTGFAAQTELHAFTGNLGLLGAALIFLVIPQPWGASLDEWVRSRAATLRGLPERTAVEQDAAAGT